MAYLTIVTCIENLDFKGDIGLSFLKKEKEGIREREHLAFVDCDLLFYLIGKGRKFVLHGYFHKIF